MHILGSVVPEENTTATLRPSMGNLDATEVFDLTVPRWFVQSLDVQP
jgi:hypothetical protein